MEYKWRRLAENLKGADTLSAQTAAAEEFLKTAALGLSTGKINPITRGIIVSWLSMVMGLSQEVINEELRKHTGRLGTTGSYAVPNQKVVSIELPGGYFAKAQQEILEVLLNKPGMYEKLRGQVKADMFDVPALKHIASILFGLIEKQANAGIADVLSNIEDQGQAAVAVKLADEGEKKAGFGDDVFEKQLQDAVKAFEEHRILLEGRKSQDDESLRKFVSKLSKGNLRSAGL
jgi:hypothetical protein